MTLDEKENNQVKIVKRAKMVKEVKIFKKKKSEMAKVKIAK